VASQPYKPVEARKRISAIVNSGGAVVMRDPHATSEMKADGLDMQDVEDALRRGRCSEPAEEVRGEWRYRLHGQNATVVVAVEDANTLAVVTVWKAKGRSKR